MSGFRTEDYFIDRAESIGIAPTLCSYHKHFLGTVESGVMPSPAFIAVTSAACDGNINTMRYAALRRGMKFCRGCTSRGFRGSGALCRVSAV